MARDPQQTLSSCWQNDTVNRVTKFPKGGSEKRLLKIL